MGRRARRSLLRSALFSAGRRSRQPFPARTCLAPTTQRTPAASFHANSCFGPYISPSDCIGDWTLAIASTMPSAPTLTPLKVGHGGSFLPCALSALPATDPSLEVGSLPPLLSAERIAHRRRRR